MNISQLERETVKKVSLRLIPFLFLCFAVATLDRVNIGFAALKMNQELGFSSAVYGLGAGIFFIGYFIMEIPGSAIMTKMGAKAWISRIMISWGIIASLMAFVSTPLQFYAARFFLGVAEASFFPCIAWYLSSFYQTKNHAKAIAGFMMAMPIASAVGAPISTYILNITFVGWSSWRWLFIIEAIPAIILGIIAIFYLTNKIEDANWLNEEERKWLIDVTTKEKLKKQEQKPYTFMQAMGDHDVLKLAAAYFTWVCGYYGLVMFLPILVKKLSTTMSVITVGWVVGLMYLIATISMFLVSRHSDKTNERRHHVAVCLIIAAVGLICSIYFANVNVILTIIIYTISLSGVFGAFSPFWSIPPSFLSGVAAASAIALVNSIGNLGGFVGPYVMGFVTTTTGSSKAGIWFLAISMIASACIVTFLLKQTGKAQHVNSKENINMN